MTKKKANMNPEDELVEIVRRLKDDLCCDALAETYSHAERAEELVEQLQAELEKLRSEQHDYIGLWEWVKELRGAMEGSTEKIKKKLILYAPSGTTEHDV